MRFESGKSNLKDIHSFMTKVDQLRLRSRERSVESKNFERFLLVECGIGEVRAEIDIYKNNIIRSKQYLSNFQELKAMHLKKRA